MRSLALAAVALLLTPVAHAGRADVGGYFRVMARPDLQGGQGRLGYWNLYGRLLNEGPYGMLELRYDVLEPTPGSDEVWTALHARIEGGSIGNADPGDGSLELFRLSQMYVKSGNLLLSGVTWQVGTLESFFGDLGLYDMRPATVFFRTVGASARYESDTVELLLGAGDSGYALNRGGYNAVPTVGGTLRLRPVKGLELGGGGELHIEGGRAGNVNAPYQTPDIAYEDWVRGEVTETYIEQFPGLEDYFPNPVARTSQSWKLVGYLGFGGFGPLQWNNLFLSLERQHPEKKGTEDLAGAPVDIYVHDFTDERQVFTLGDELYLTVVPRRLDLALGVLYGNHTDADNDIVPSDHDRWYGSSVLRLQAYATPKLHFLAETSLAREVSRNGNAYRQHADSIFANTAGRPDTRGLEYGDSATRDTWQGKGGIVLNPLGPGIHTRPSLRLLYGVQHSTQNNAFGNSFVVTLDQYDDFEAVEQHLHHLLAAEAEVWF